MYPIIPTEMVQEAVQLATYFVTIIGAMLGLDAFQPRLMRRRSASRELKIANLQFSICNSYQRLSFRLWRSHAGSRSSRRFTDPELAGLAAERGAGRGGGHRWLETEGAQLDHLPLVVGGWVYSIACFGLEGLAWSVCGTLVGLALLLPAYAIGGMGSGDVKLLAGVGAWVWATNTFYAFCVSAILGGVIAIAMVLWRRDWYHHWYQFWALTNEILRTPRPRDPCGQRRPA